MFALIERGGELRAQKVDLVSGKNLEEIIRQNVDPSSHIITDGFLAFNDLGREFASHETVNHGKREYISGEVHVNLAKNWFSLLKRGITGTFRHISRQHLDRYVGEYQYRYNNRKESDSTRSKNAIRGAEGKRLIYKETNIKSR